MPTADDLPSRTDALYVRPQARDLGRSPSYCTHCGTRLRAIAIEHATGPWPYGYILTEPEDWCPVCDKTMFETFGLPLPKAPSPPITLNATVRITLTILGILWLVERCS